VKPATELKALFFILCFLMLILHQSLLGSPFILSSTDSLTTGNIAPTSPDSASYSVGREGFYLI